MKTACATYDFGGCGYAIGSFFHELMDFNVV
jgi:hypothetical protein